MKVHYKATVHSQNKEIDGLPMQIAVGSKVTCKIRDVQPLCQNCIEGSKEHIWYTTQVLPRIVDK